MPKIKRVHVNVIGMLGVIAGTIFAGMGYKLFETGVINAGNTSLQASGFFGKWVMTGTAPGLFFMMVGAIIVIVSIVAAVRQYRHQSLAAKAWEKANKSKPSVSEEIYHLIFKP